MKRLATMLLVLLICAGCAKAPAVQSSSQQEISAPSNSEAAASFEASDAFSSLQLPLPQPVLVTSFGQSTDSILVREMLTDIKLDFTYSSTASADMLSDYKTIVIAVGASNKSLASSGMDSKQELERCTKFAASLSEEYNVVAVRLGNSHNQSELTTNLINIAAEKADVFITTQSGDESGAIKKLTDSIGAVYCSCPHVREMASIWERLFSVK